MQGNTTLLPFIKNMDTIQKEAMELDLDRADEIQQARNTWLGTNSSSFADRESNK